MAGAFIRPRQGWSRVHRVILAALLLSGGCTTPSATQMPAMSVSRPAVARLAGGVEVCLVGLENVEDPAGQWYGPDGVPLWAEPFPPIGIRPQDQGRGEEDIELDLAFTFTAKPDPANGPVHLKMADPPTGSDQAPRLDSRPAYPVQRVGPVGAHLNDQLPGTWCVHAVASKKLPLTVRLQVAMGPWTAAGGHVEKPFEDNGAASVVAFEPQRDASLDKRWVAIDVDGAAFEAQRHETRYRLPAERRAVPGLDLPLPALHLQEKTLADILDVLSRAANVTINVDWPAMEKDGHRSKKPVRPSTRLTVTSVDGEMLNTVLNRVLGRAAASTGGIPSMNDFIAAVDGHGLLVRPTIEKDWFCQKLYVPALPLNRLAHFEYQTRPFDRFLEFRGIPTPPGRAGSITILTSDETEH